MEIAGHEFWSADGKRGGSTCKPAQPGIWLRCPSRNRPKRAKMNADHGHSLHVSRDGKLFPGRGAPRQLRCQRRRWIYLHPKKRANNQWLAEARSRLRNCDMSSTTTRRAELSHHAGTQWFSSLDMPAVHSSGAMKSSNRSRSAQDSG